MRATAWKIAACPCLYADQLRGRRSSRASAHGADTVVGTPSLCALSPSNGFLGVVGYAYTYGRDGGEFE
jgi:hypothetical protein